MKKVWKGFAAAVSAAAIAATGFIGATSAYAAPEPAATGSITVKNAAKDDTFNAYRLLGLTTGTGDNGTTTYSYKLIPVPRDDSAYSNETRALVKAINATNNKTAADEGYLAIPGASATANEKTKFEQDLIAAINAYKGTGSTTDDSANMRTFAKNLIAAVKDTTANPPTNVVTKTATANEAGDLVLADLDPGYYLVDHASQKNSTAVEDPNSTSLSAYLVDTVTAGSNTDLTLKNGTVQLTKKVEDWNDTTGRPANPSWQDSADHDLGDKVPFQLTGTLPANYDRYDTFNYIFTDTLSPGLTRNNDVKVYAVNGTGETQTKQEITNSFDTKIVTAQNLTSNPKVGEKFTVGVKNSAAAGQTPVYNLKAITQDDNKAAVTIDKDTKIVVEYTATLNDSAVIGSAGNPNKAYLQFSNNPNNGGDGDFGHTPEDTVIVFTYQFNVNKTFSNNPPAEDDMPQFTLYKSYPAIPADATDAEKAKFTPETIGEGENAKTIYWKNIQTVTVQPYQVTENDEQVTKYKAEFPRIDDGNYKVVESRVPQGYNQADDVFFKVEATHSDNTQTPALTELKITFYTDATFTTTATTPASTITDNDKLTAGVVSVGIENKSGSELPSTGGMGTTVLYVAGAAIVLIAGIGLAVALRRRQA